MSKRLPINKPSQTHISVQDVRHTKTGAGINMENEEMRRIELAFRQLQDDLKALKDKVEPPKETPKNPLLRDLGGGTSQGDINNIILNGGGGGKWALTILHKGVRIFREKWQQAINFIDGTISGATQPFFKVPIGFEIESETIANDLKADPTHPSTQAKVSASAYIDLRNVLGSLQGRMSIVKNTAANQGEVNIHGQPLFVNTFLLVNDEENPAAVYYYGTNDAGVKGWYSLVDVINDTVVFPDPITGDEHNTVRFNASGELVETSDLRVSEAFIELNLPSYIQNGQTLTFFNVGGTYGISFVNDGATENVIYKLPIADGDDLQVLTTDGLGQLSWTTVSGSLPAGTNTYTLYFDGTDWVADDIISVADGTPPLITMRGQLQMLAGNRIGFLDTTNTYATYFQSHPTPTATTSYYLPPADGTTGQFLKTDGSGNLSWETVSGGGTNAVKLYKLDFDKSLASPQTHGVTLLTGTEILKITVVVDSTLTGSAGQIRINGTTPIVLADEGTHYLSGAGQYITEYTGISSIASALFEGQLEYTQPGAGSGVGRIFIEVGEPI